MSMLEKFKNFEVKEEDQISDADKRFLENWEKQYESVIRFYRDVYTQSKEVENNMDPTSIPQYSSLRLENFRDKVLKMVCKIQREYPNHIYSHFRRGYQIEIKSNEDLLSEKYQVPYKATEEQVEKLFTLQDYHAYVADILDQTGGQTFDDLARQQLKGKMKEACLDYDSNWKISLKGKTLKYTGWAFREWFRSYTSEDNFITLFSQVLGYFIFGRNVMPHELSPITHNYRLELDEEQMKNGFYFSESFVLEKIKFFKNGRIDIKFRKEEDARKFVSKWCGYPLAI